MEKEEFNSLVTSLYDHPTYHPEYESIRRKIENALTADKYKEKLICFQSKMNHVYNSDVATNDHSSLDLNEINGIKEYDNIPADTIFSASESFLEDKRFFYPERKLVEYCPTLKQISVALIISDRSGSVLLLETNPNGDTRIQGKQTMIQGHVNFSPEVYTMSQVEYLRHSVGREFTEEVEGAHVAEFMRDFVSSDIDPYVLINDRTNYIGLEHLGVIFHVTIDDIIREFPDIRTNEPNKHSVLIRPGFFSENSDNWTSMVLKKLFK